MDELAVTEDEVRRVLDGPHTARRSQMYSGTTLISGTVHRRRIIIAAVCGSQPLLIKTVMVRSA